MAPLPRLPLHASVDDEGVMGEEGEGQGGGVMHVRTVDSAFQPPPLGFRSGVTRMLMAPQLEWEGVSGGLGEVVVW
jgi:hypothetical protein